MSSSSSNTAQQTQGQHGQGQQPYPTLSRRPVSALNEDFQKQIQQDWANREYIEVISGSIKRIADFLNSFGTITLKLT
jgi:hypothetical protein